MRQLAPVELALRSTPRDPFLIVRGHLVRCHYDAFGTVLFTEELLCAVDHWAFA